MSYENRILHVDDSESDRELLQMLLSPKLKGIKLESCNSAKEALSLLHESRTKYACIISDYEMPEMNGLDFLTQLRVFDAETPLVFLTGQGNEDVATTAFHMGADDYFVKGIGTGFYDRLAHRIKNLVKTRQEKHEYRKTRNELETLEYRQKQLFQNLSDAVFTISLDGRVIDMNDYGAELFKIKQEDRYVTKSPDFYDSNSQRLKIRKKLLMQGQIKDEVVHFRKADGEPFTGLMTASVFENSSGQIVGFQGVVRDVTDRLEMEQELRQSRDDLKERIKELQCLTGVASLLEENSLTTGELTRKLIAILKKSYLKPENMSVHVNIAGVSTYSEHFAADSQWKDTVNIKAHDIECGFIEVAYQADEKTTSNPFLDEEHQMLKSVADQLAVYLDRNKTLEELRKRERDYMEIFEKVPVGIYRTTLAGEILKANPSLISMLGYDTFEELAERDLKDEQFFGKKTPRSDLIERLKKEKAIRSQESEWVKKDGSTIVVSENLSLAYREDGSISYIHGVVEDITDKKIIENELAQSQKMQAIGQLAAGIAHEINTPMQFISDNVSFLKAGFKALMTSMEPVVSGSTTSEEEMNERMQKFIEYLKGGKLKRIFDEIPGAIEESLEGIEGVTKIVRAMKEFSHPGTENKQLMNLNELVNSVVTISKNEWKYTSDVKLDLDDTLPPVHCHPKEFNQVLLNMIINAVHAIEERQQRQNDSRGLITISTSSNGTPNTIAVKVADNGCGIPEKNRANIFEPFFTTKDIGKGTGQGLALSYDIITKKHGGTISVESEEGVGSVFKITLPRMAEEAEGELIG